jgi:hypothetical protein
VNRLRLSYAIAIGLIVFALFTLADGEAFGRYFISQVDRGSPQVSTTVTGKDNSIMQQQDGLFIQPQRLSSITEAEEKTSFSILIPERLPTDMKLDGVLYFVMPNSAPKGADWVILFYKGESGRALSIRQGNTPLPYKDKSTPASVHGTTNLGRRSAIWVDGLPEVSSMNPVVISGWKRGVLSIGWEPTQDPDSPLPRTYVLATGGLNRQELEQVAASVP